jgi:hypothetical protein
VKITPGALHAYLGDGLYAEDDGFMLTLKCDRMEGQHWVGLEPEIIQALFKFIERSRNVEISVRRREEEPKSVEEPFP